MKKNRLKILIVVLLLAVALLTAGLIHIEKNRTARDSGSAGEATEQAADGQAETGQDDAGEAAEGQETGPLATVFFASDYQSEEGFDAPADTLAALIDEAEADGGYVRVFGEERFLGMAEYTADGSTIKPHKVLAPEIKEEWLQSSK